MIFYFILRIHWRHSTILRISKKVYKVMFFDTLYVEIKTQILKKFPSEKINGTKNVFIFLSRAPTHCNFIFNSRFLYELKHKVCLSKTVCGIFHIQFRFVFIKVFIFLQQNAWTLGQFLSVSK